MIARVWAVALPGRLEGIETALRRPSTGPVWHRHSGPPDAIWPWLVQMGQDRGGFYSHDWLERLFGAEIHNADRIRPEMANARGRGHDLALSGAQAARNGKELQRHWWVEGRVD